MLLDQTMLLSLLAASAAAVGPTELPPNHPAADVISKFGHQFRCPYANEWVAKGPKQAAIDLGLVQNVASLHSTSTTYRNNRSIRGRRNMQDATVAGSCSYTNTWTGQSACLELRGDVWTTDSMQTRCDLETDSNLTISTPCTLPASLGGWCFVVGEDGAVEVSPLALTGTMDCAQLETTCETFISGTFKAAEGCGASTSAPTSGEDTNTTEPSNSNTTYPDVSIPAGNVTCIIAPGAIGAGHQAAFSSGYRPDCEGTPAEGSPYMWPMAWTAHIESESMAFGSDKIWYTSRGHVFYRLDKNWKRADTYYQRGIQRSIGQAPCPSGSRVEEMSNGPVSACRRDSDDYTTMIHRGNKMFFISWKNDTEVGSSDPEDIEECIWIDLQVIGNIRPDWYMDSRGDSTGVQYLGNQHVYHNNKPRLVKQWRKKDFSDQYFVMSVLGNPEDDGIHWPMVLNVPGEGFGDDFLQKYSNQSLLTDDDDYLFLLDEALEGIGGSCQQIIMDGSGAGPPTSETDPIPSNLEVDVNSWFDNEYTYSPVWDPVQEMGDGNSTGNNSVAITEAGNVVVESCYNSTTNSVDLTFKFMGIELVEGGTQLPWVAVGYRETDECLMNPRGGGDTEVIFLTAVSSEDSMLAPQFAMLPVAAKSFNGSAVTSIYDSMVPLSEKEGFSSVNLNLPLTMSEALSRSVVPATGEDADKIVLHFQQSMTDGAPEVMHLMYAIGNSATVGYHKTRECFDIVSFPACPVMNAQEESSGDKMNSNTGSSAASLTVGVVVVVSTFLPFFL